MSVPLVLSIRFSYFTRFFSCQYTREANGQVENGDINLGGDDYIKELFGEGENGAICSNSVVISGVFGSVTGGNKGLSIVVKGFLAGVVKLEVQVWMVKEFRLLSEREMRLKKRKN